MSIHVFYPQGQTRALNASTTPQSIQHPNLSAAQNGTLLVSNKTTSWATVSATKNAVAVAPATPGLDSDGVPIPPNSSMVIMCPLGARYINAVLDSGTGVLAFTAGFGD